MEMYKNRKYNENAKGKEAYKPKWYAEKVCL
jgi:hypothetical protein